MTTITIKNSVDNKNILCENTQEAMETLAEMYGFKILWNVTDADRLKKLEKHFEATKNLPFESFDNI